MAALRLLQPPALITAGRVLYEGRDVLAMSEEELRAFRWKKSLWSFKAP
jgi:peptide/nickel transport system ATP-binding protein